MNDRTNNERHLPERITLLARIHLIRTIEKVNKFIEGDDESSERPSDSRHVITQLIFD